MNVVTGISVFLSMNNIYDQNSSNYNLENQYMLDIIAINTANCEFKLIVIGINTNTYIVFESANTDTHIYTALIQRVVMYKTSDFELFLVIKHFRDTITI